MSALSAASCLKSQVLTIYRKRPILCRTKSGLLIEILNISSVTWTTCFPLLKKIAKLHFRRRKSVVSLLLQNHWLLNFLCLCRAITLTAHNIHIFTWLQHHKHWWLDIDCIFVQKIKQDNCKSTKYFRLIFQFDSLSMSRNAWILKQLFLCSVLLLQ